MNTDVAREFLDRIAPYYGSGLLNLVAIDPTMPTGSNNLIGRFFTPTDRAGQIEFIEQYLPSQNLYYGLNPVRKKPRTGRPKKTDISNLVALGIDVDPRTSESQTEDNKRTLDAIANFPLPPTSIVNSGRGIQA